jgi:hypothetical protein
MHGYVCFDTLSGTERQFRFPIMPDPAKPERRLKPKPSNPYEVAVLNRKLMLIRSSLVLFGVAVIVAIGFMTHWIMSARQNSAGALPGLVNIKPPEFLDSVVCDLNAGINTTGIRTFIRNIGDARARNVIETFTLHLVPDKKVGIPEFDEIPQGDCKAKPSAKPLANLMESGEQATPVLPARLLKMPPLLRGEAAQLYGTSCFYYDDDSGNAHSSCETRHFTLAGGAPVFICEDAPRTGAFDPAPVATCGN